MNNNKYLKGIEYRNRKVLLKYYLTISAKINNQIYEAAVKGNNTTYLKSLQRDVDAEVAQLQAFFKSYSIKANEYAYKSGAKLQGVMYEQLALPLVAENVVNLGYTFGRVNREAVAKLAEATYKPLSKIGAKIGRDTKEYFTRTNFKDTQSILKSLGKLVDENILRDAGLKSAQGVIVGSETWQQAMRSLRDDLLKQDICKIPYYKKDGTLARMVEAKDYAKMVSRTTTAIAFREGAKDRILENFDGVGDLVEVLGNSIFPNSPCIPFEGKILSLEGITEGYTTIDEAESKGLFHPNCIHSFGVSQKVTEEYTKLGAW